jgi:opacity protein-like surface antigen
MRKEIDMKKCIPILFVLLLFLPASLSAEENEAEEFKFGLTFPDIGAIWHMTDRIAFLPGISFTHSWSEFGTNDETYNNSSNALVINAGLRFYLYDWEDLRFYVSPGYRFGWVDSESDFSANTSYGHGVSGAWGLQYALNKRLSLYGDIGVSYNRTSPSDTDGHSSLFGTRGTWGLILYLK